MAVRGTGRKRFSRDLTRGSRRSSSATEVESWSPPDFEGHRSTRIGASVVEQFVAGHDPGDVLRELVQNEFDGGGDRLSVTFGSDALNVVGNGRDITSDGWKRLSVIVGTGRVMGDSEGERVAPKSNGIGSKNFGLRSLFLFGDEIFVRSGGQVCVLDLRTLETGRIRDQSSWDGKGVRLRVPFRQEPYEMLEAFTSERELQAFEIMAGGMLATLVKLALSGRHPGLRQVTLQSTRNDRSLIWKQDAENVRSTLKGITITHRFGRLYDSQAGVQKKREFEEMEFGASVNIPDKFVDRAFPAYFKAGRGAFKISVSVPLMRRRIDQSRLGHFHYPLQAPDAWTGCLIGVNAPFDLNSDRSSLLNNSWNDWLIDEAARLTVELLVGDWFDRFGPAAFRVLARTSPASPSRFIDAVERRLGEQPCWPSRATGSERFAKASQVVIATDSELDGFMPNSRYLDLALVADATARNLAIAAGAQNFTLSSLIRLRCAGADTRQLKTKLQPAEANWNFEDYETTLRDATRQAAMALALTKLSRRLSNANREDLRSTASTLTATGNLRPAHELVRVAPEIWEVCPEPRENRLHPSLVGHRGIAGLCHDFDEQTWMVQAADRALEGTAGEAEKEALYVRVLDERTFLGRSALTAIRKSPVMKNERGEWAAAGDMVSLKGAVAKLIAPAVSGPSKEMIARADLLLRLRIRDRLNTADLVAFAVQIQERPQSAERFETLLSDNQRLITPAAAKQLLDVSFLRAKSGVLAAPASLHLDTPANRLCISDTSRLVSGTNEALYRRLRIREHPAVETLIDMIEMARSRSEPPGRPEIIYPAIVAGLFRERRPKLEFADVPILWINGAYRSPSEVLVGTHISRVLDRAVPVLRRSDELAHAYVSLGAKSQAGDEHWATFFRHIHEEWEGEPLPIYQRRVLMEAYRQRGHQGVPDGLDALKFLLARDGRLYSPNELQAGTLVENDFPALADGLAGSGSSLGVVDVSDRNRAFFLRLNIRPLSSIAGAGSPVFGNITAQPFWFKLHHQDRLLAMMRRAIFAKALHAIALRQHHVFFGFNPAAPEELVKRLHDIGSVAFYSEISREYSVGTAKARVAVEAAIGEGLVGLVAPKTKLDFQQLVAQALAEVAGAANVAQARSLSIAFLPLVLCRNVEDMVVYMERMGVTTSEWDRPEEPELEFDADRAEELGEEIIRQVVDALETRREPSAAAEAPPNANPPQVALPVAPPPSPPAELPAINDVELVVAQSSDQTIAPRPSQSGGWGGAGRWMPRTVSEMERDRAVGLRGEELVYRMECERVRSAGHPNAESVVIWTSRTDPGADHDIRSVDEGGRPRWIEVKSTIGNDGRFDWSRKEFEKAMREGDRYELWRVYRASSMAPVAKPFRNPARMLGESRMQLELGSLRACVEDIG
jgi:hypothetical protein